MKNHLFVVEIKVREEFAMPPHAKPLQPPGYCWSFFASNF